MPTHDHLPQHHSGGYHRAEITAGLLVSKKKFVGLITSVFFNISSIVQDLITLHGYQEDFKLKFNTLREAISSSRAASS